MFFRWYRKKIAEAVEAKMCYMNSCPNEKEIILNIIAPKDYKRKSAFHCNIDCRNKDCKSRYGNTKR